jgi:5-methylcytosine-specific restriction endonuclease McrA
MMRPCLDCGRLAHGSRCRICKTIRNRTNPYATSAWRQLSLAVVERDAACVECGGTCMLSAHHIIPRAEGGPDTLANLEALCVACHGREEARRRAGNG